jgi:hypothetical protein
MRPARFAWDDQTPLPWYMQFFWSEKDQDISRVPHLTRALILTYYMALVRKRTIPTEQPPLVGEVSANFCG